MNLRQYLTIHNLSVTRFSVQTGINRANLHKYLSGTVIPSYDIAKLIEIATEGQVSLRELREPKCRQTPNDPSLACPNAPDIAK